MSIQNIFYGVAVFFLLVTIGYFVGEYLDYISTSIKVVLSYLTAVILFTTGDILRRKNY